MSFTEERTELRECGMDIPRLFTPSNTVSMHLVVLCISVINGLMFNEPFHLAGGGGGFLTDPLSMRRFTSQMAAPVGMAI